MRSRGVFLILILLLPFLGRAEIVGGGLDTINQLNPFVVSGGVIRTSSTTAGLKIPYFIATSTTATSTAANGINLTGGCFSINNVCVGSGAGTVTGSGTAGMLASWSSATALTATGTPTFAAFVSTSTATSTMAGGLSLTRFNISATSTGSKGIDLAGGCFAINGVCLGSGTITGSGTVGQIAYFNGISSITSAATGTVSAGAGISVTPGQSVIGSGLTVTNTGVTSIVAGTNISISGATGAVTISSTASGNGNVATSTNETAGQVPYWTSTNGTPATLGKIATGTVSSSGGITVTAARYVLNGALSIACDVASSLIPGCLSSTDWSTFNNKENVLSFVYPLVRSGNSVSQAFGTTTANTWSAHNIFSSLFATNSSSTNATTTNLHITSLTSALLQADANGKVEEYAGTTCTNQFVRVLSALGIATCATVTSSDIDSSIAISARNLTVAGTANQVSVSGGTQNLTADRTWTASLPSHVIFPSSYQASLGSTTNATSTNLTITGNLIHEGLTSAMIITGANGAFAEYTGTSCTNQFVRALSALGVATCATVANTDLANSTIGLTSSGSVTVGGSPISLGGSGSVDLNMGNANSWTALQTFTNLIGTGSSTINSLSIERSTTTNATTTGTFAYTGSATSTFTNGINLSAGCFAINNTCVGSSSVTPGGNNGAVQFNNSGSFGGDEAKFVWNNTAKRLGVGTSSPGITLDTKGWIRSLSSNDIPTWGGDGLEMAYFTAGNYGFIGSLNRDTGLYKKLVIAGATTTILSETNTVVTVGDGNINNDGFGFVGIGTTTASRKLGIVGSIYASSTANYSTSTFQGQSLDLITGAGRTGCFAINGSCIGGSNLTGAGAANRAAFWTSAGNLSYDDKFVWNNTSKQLYIGTSTGSSILSVENNSGDATTTFISNDNSNADFLLAERNQSTMALYGFIFRHIGGNNRLDINAINAGVESNAMTINRSAVTNPQFVGIGSTTPGARLSVAGSILADDHITTSYFTATSTTATSTFANGVNITSGCFAVGGTCIGAGAVTSVSNSDGSLTISPTTGAVVGSINVAHRNDWSVHQTFSSLFATLASTTNATTTNLTVTGNTILGSLSGFIKATAGVLSTALVDLTSDITGTLGWGNGGTGQTSFTRGAVIHASESSDKFLGDPADISYVGGNFGIGTSTPYAKLAVAGTVVGQNFVATSTTATSTFASAIGIGTTTAVASVTIDNASTSTPPFVFNMTGTPGTATTTNSMWVDNLTKTITAYFGSLKLRYSGTLFANSQTLSFQNSNTETSIVPAAVSMSDGTTTIPANFLTTSHHIVVETGQMLTVKPSASGGSVTGTFKIKANGTTLCTTSNAYTSDGSNKDWTSQVSIPILATGASGSVWCTGFATGITTTGSTHPTFNLTSNTATTIDTTVPQNITATWQWSSANANNQSTTTLFRVMIK